MELYVVQIKQCPEGMPYYLSLSSEDNDLIENALRFDYALALSKAENYRRNWPKATVKVIKV